MTDSTTRALDRHRPAPTYGWSADGKTPAEIRSDIRQTKHRVNADLEAIKSRVKWPAAGIALGLVALLIGRRLKR